MDRFARFCERAARALGDLIPYACTINEANIPVMLTLMREGGNPASWTRPKSFAQAARGFAAATRRGFAPYLSATQQACDRAQSDRGAPQEL